MIETIKNISRQRAIEVYDTVTFNSAFESADVRDQFLESEVMTINETSRMDDLIEVLLSELPDDFDEDDDIDKLLSATDDVSDEELLNL